MLNKFVKLLGAIVLLGLVFTAMYALAICNHLIVIYPKNGSIIHAKSTFFIGNTNPNATMTINGKPVKVYPNGAFVRVFSLKQGENLIVLKSTLNNDVKLQKMSLHVSAGKIASSNNNVAVPYNEPIVVVEKEAPLRATPYGDRLSPIKEGMIFQAVEIVNNHYKVKYNDGYAYILKPFAKTAHVAKISEQVSEKISFEEDGKNIFVNVKVEQPTPVKIVNEANTINVKLDGVKLKFKNHEIDSQDINGFYFDENSFSITLNSSDINGYEYYYDKNKFVLKIRKPFTKGIEGKIIVIDPGHGGKEHGSIGPTGVPEKDLNLKISNYLKDELEKVGAQVYMTREKDWYVDLYDRVDFAQKKKADILVSIHNNALPDGQNPYITHGTETYYYQPQAKNLASIVQKNLLQKNGFNNLGIKTGSFVLTRPTNPVSILVEVGFMINPYEYAALLVSENQQKYAEGIKNGIVEYFQQ